MNIQYLRDRIGWELEYDIRAEVSERGQCELKLVIKRTKSLASAARMQAEVISEFQEMFTIVHGSELL